MDHCVQSSDLEGTVPCRFSLENVILKLIRTFFLFFFSK